MDLQTEEAFLLSWRFLWSLTSADRKLSCLGVHLSFSALPAWVGLLPPRNCECPRSTGRSLPALHFQVSQMARLVPDSKGAAVVAGLVIAVRELLSGVYRAVISTGISDTITKPVYCCQTCGHKRLCSHLGNRSFNTEALLGKA